MADTVTDQDPTAAAPPEMAAGRVRRPLGLRLLGWFWGALLVAGVAGGIRLHMLGPPGPDPGGTTVAAGTSANTAAVSSAEHAPPAGHGPQSSAGHAAVGSAPSEVAPHTDPPAAEHGGPAHAEAGPAPPHVSTVVALAETAHGSEAAHPPSPAASEAQDHAQEPGGIRAPVAALLEKSEGDPNRRLPRIAADGRTPRQVYAASFDGADRRPRVSILLGGIGQSESDAEEASRSLPAAISFVVSPYTMRPERLLDGIRAHGHEMLVGLPMEPLNYPVNDEGNAALLTVASPEQNDQRLDWALSRIEGFVGATNALDGLRGERFSAATVPIGIVLRQLAARGLIYVDATPALSRFPRDLPALPMRGIDAIIDEPAVRSEIDAKLAALEQLARERGAALGLAGLPRPVTLSRIAAWSAGLDARGIALAPVSTLVAMPGKRAEARTNPAP